MHRSPHLAIGAVVLWLAVALPAPVLAAGQRSPYEQNDRVHFPQGRLNAPVSQLRLVELNDRVHNRVPQASQPFTSVVVRDVRGGFDWIDATIGAVAAFGAALAGGAAIVLVMRRQAPAARS